MPSLNDRGHEGQTGRTYWRSLEHMADTPEFRAFMHREFPAGASELLDSGERRHFLKIMGASMALAGLGAAGCRRWPDEHIAPYAHRPEGHDPGVAQYFATCWDVGGVAAGLVATSWDGRPTKLEGNEAHPTSFGAASSISQASVLNLYDPDRSEHVIHDGVESTWAAFSTWAASHFTGSGRGLAVLSEANSSPSYHALRRRFAQRFPEASWHEYEPLCNDEQVDGSERVLLAAYRTQHDLAASAVTVCLDADLLGNHPNAVANIHGFAASRRRVDETHDMSRLYVVEPTLSVTGANADDRVAIKAADVAVVAAYLATRILGAQELGMIEQDPAAVGVLTPAVRAKIDAMLHDLEAHHGSSVIAVGANQPAPVQALVHLMNERLGNVAKTVMYTPLRDAIAQTRSITDLAGRMDAGEIATLVMVGGNPVYNAPSDLAFAERLAKVPTTIHLSDYVDETSQRSTWHINRAHYLEAWGDGRAWDGTYSIAQPLILPLFDGHSPLELLATIAGEVERDGRVIVDRTFGEMVGGDREALWRRTLHDGFLPGSATPVMPRAITSDYTSIAQDVHHRWTTTRDGWEIVFTPDATIYDGRFGNNGWLQELPDPITKLTWDNAVLVSPQSARELDVKSGDMVTVGAGARSVDAAVMIVPGLAYKSAALSIGYGRTTPGPIAVGAGFNFMPLRTTATMGFAAGATVTKTRGRYILATTQDHHTIDVDTVGGQGIQTRLGSIFREADLEEFNHHPNFAAHRTHVVHRLSMWDESNLDGAEYAWGLTIDLNSCVGCGACVAACQAENNIPIVGKEQVVRGREMHWIRIDRYFKFGKVGDAYDPDVVESVALQPVMCMMCENAPCEQVCPVAATVHDADGLNLMVYNRCIGTRYCSNNCPYKVRRFNFFDYHRRDPVRTKGGLLQVQPSYYTRDQATPQGLLAMQFNPEVTVRMRGVMEKCTYCIQRIAVARITAKNAYAQLSEQEKRARSGQRIEVPDGAITPACAQTCPAEAIVFGDLLDRESRVAELQRNPRAYEMLEELHVKPRTKFLAKVRNPVDGPGGSGGPASHGDESDHS